MSENIRGGKKSKEGEKGDGKCYFPCKRCCTARPVRILIATTKRHCRRYGHIDGGSNEYRPMVISYIFIICLYIDCIYKILYCFNICYTH
jgi:hypothetical protein